MGEYVWTDMEIGGKLTRDLAEQLQELSFDAGDNSDVIESAEAKQSMKIAGQVNYGNPEDLEKFCIEHKLAFRCSWAAQPGNFHTGMKFWFPDMPQPVDYDANDDGRPVLTLEDLMKAMKEGKALSEVMAAHERALAPIPPIELIEVRRIEVTVPLKLDASMTFTVDEGTEVTGDLIAEKIADAQRARDRAGTDDTGISFIIAGHEPPQFNRL